MPCRGDGQVVEENNEVGDQVPTRGEQVLSNTQPRQDFTSAPTDSRPRQRVRVTQEDLSNDDDDDDED